MAGAGSSQDVDLIWNMLMGRMGAALVKGSTPPQQQEPVAAPVEQPQAEPTPTTYKADAIASIISETYNMPGVPESTKRRCAKRRIAERYGEEEAKKYLRTTRKKVPAASAPPPDKPVETTTPVPTPTVTPVAPLVSSEAPILSIDETLRKMLSSGQQEEPMMSPAP